MQETNNQKNDSQPHVSMLNQLTVADRIQLLVDNELDEFERTQLFRDLDRSPDGWKKCAVAFCDEQFLKHEFELLEQTPPPQKPDSIRTVKSSSLSPHRNIIASVAIALSLTLGLGIGIYSGPESNPMLDDTVATVEQTSVQTMVQEAKDLVNEGKTTDSIPIDLPITRLFELENNDLQTTYLSPDPLPEFILQSMVFAGHEVEVSQEHIETAISRSRTISVPIYELRIIKNRQHMQVVQNN